MVAPTNRVFTGSILEVAEIAGSLHEAGYKLDRTSAELRKKHTAIEGKFNGSIEAIRSFVHTLQAVAAYPDETSSALEQIHHWASRLSALSGSVAPELLVDAVTTFSRIKA